jgi:hypothetical protein
MAIIEIDKKAHRVSQEVADLIKNVSKERDFY